MDAWESHLRSFASLRPDNPITETGILGEVGHHPVTSRFGQKRTDVKHQWMDPLIVASPWLAAPLAVAIGVRALTRRRRAA